MTQDRLRFRVPLLAIVLAAVVALAAPVSATAAPSGARVPSSQQPIKVVTVHALHGRKYVLKIWAKGQSKHCLAHAHGAQVRHYLRTHHCVGLTRYLVTTKVNGHAVGFAQSAVSFTAHTEAGTLRAAGGFRKLLNQGGTGNFDTLFHEGDRLPSGPHSVPHPDTFYALSQDNGVTGVDAWYLHRSTPKHSRPLVRMIEDIYLQWFV